MHHKDPLIIPVAGQNNKEFTTAAARFALLGFELNRQTRAFDGRVTFCVSKAAQTYHLSHWGDVLAMLNRHGGR